MSLNSKTKKFSNIILKHYPLKEANHNNPENLKPFMPVHDRRKEREIFEKSNFEKLDDMRSFKEEGNKHYQHQRFAEASHFYLKAILVSDYTFPKEESEKKEMKEILQKVNSNMGLCQLQCSNKR